jgi:hypothetical protein
MTKGLEIRAQIDTEVVKGLLIINGGGAVALMAFLPSVLDKPDYETLVKAILVALLVFLVGLVFAVIHNRLRRECSLTFEEYNMKPPACDKFPLKLIKFKRDPPCICRASVVFMWLSVFCFTGAGLVVTVGGFMAITNKQLSNGCASENSGSLKRAPVLARACEN